MKSNFKFYFFSAEILELFGIIFYLKYFDNYYLFFLFFSFFKYNQSSILTLFLNLFYSTSVVSKLK